MERDVLWQEIENSPTGLLAIHKSDLEQHDKDLVKAILAEIEDTLATGKHSGDDVQVAMWNSDWESIKAKWLPKENENV